MAVNWALGVQQGNPGESFINAFKQGQKDNEANMGKQALAALVQDPNNPRALAALAKVDPETAMKFRQQQAELVKQQLAQRQDSILKGAEILRQFNPTDQQTYSAALQAAQGAGIDVSQVPQQFNPQYVQGVIHLADALHPDNGNQVVVTPQAGAQAGIYDKATHQYTNIYSPNDGSHPVGSPAVPQVHDQASYDAVPPGSSYITPDGHTRVKQGGQMGAAPSGGFH